MFSSGLWSHGVSLQVVCGGGRQSSQTGETPAEPFRKEVCSRTAGALLTSVQGNLFAVALSDPLGGLLLKKKKGAQETSSLMCVCVFLFDFPAAQERPHVQVRRGGLRQELLRAPEAAGSHEDSQRRETLHLQGEELRQEVHNGWKPEEPPAHTHRWAGGWWSRSWTPFYKSPKHAGGNNWLRPFDSNHLVLPWWIQGWRLKSQQHWRLRFTAAKSNRTLSCFI